MQVMFMYARRRNVSACMFLNPKSKHLIQDDSSIDSSTGTIAIFKTPWYVVLCTTQPYHTDNIQSATRNTEA